MDSDLGRTRASVLAGLLWRCSFLGAEVGEVVVEATNRIEVGEVGRMLFAGLVVVPDLLM